MLLRLNRGLNFFRSDAERATPLYTMSPPNIFNRDASRFVANISAFQRGSIITAICKVTPNDDSRTSEMTHPTISCTALYLFPTLLSDETRNTGL